MADHDTGRSSFTQTGDHRAAPGAMNPALGRTSRDIASQEPAGFGPQPDAATDSGRDTFSDEDAVAEDRPRKRNPNVSPDERMGLRPTTSGDVVPDHPTDRTI